MHMPAPLHAQLAKPAESAHPQTVHRMHFVKKAITPLVAKMHALSVLQVAPVQWPQALRSEIVIQDGMQKREAQSVQNVLKVTSVLILQLPR